MTLRAGFDRHHANKSAELRAEISRVLSHALRHAPGEYGPVLDPEGWAPVSQVISGLHRLGPEREAVDEAKLHEVLESAEKKRHQISNGRIRAVHGHSMQVRPAEKPVEPPAVLFHGTARDTVPVIRVAGILSMRRRYVHLAETVEQATEVGPGWRSRVWLSGPIPAAAVEVLDVTG